MYESGLAPFRRKPLAHPSDRRATHLQGICDLHIGPDFGWILFAFVGFEQYARVG